MNPTSDSSSVSGAGLADAEEKGQKELAARRQTFEETVPDT
jgi:hypothetical protein